MMDCRPEVTRTLLCYTDILWEGFGGGRERVQTLDGGVLGKLLWHHGQCSLDYI
jgi:hypothetical protein